MNGLTAGRDRDIPEQASAVNGEVTPVLEARDVWRSYHAGGGTVDAVAGVDLVVAPGDFVALTGRSGSGKTTLLNLLGGLDRPTRGVVRLDGVDLATLGDRQITRLRRERLGFVFQAYGLIPTLSALENVELPLHLMGWSWRRRQERAREMLELVGIGKHVDHRMYELSGGQQQRVAVARALAGSPRVILADEPTGPLDTERAASIWELLAGIAATGVAIVAATHDLTVHNYASRAIAMRDGHLIPVSPAGGAGHNAQ
jgi:putative ABC transport system ATP-binding protein